MLTIFSPTVSALQYFSPIILCTFSNIVPKMLKNIKQETRSDNNNYIHIAKINSDNLDLLIVNLMKRPSFLTKSDQDHVKK